MARSAAVAVAVVVLLAFAGATPAENVDTATPATNAEAAISTPNQTAERVAEARDVSDVSDDTVEIETEGFDPDYDPAEILRRVEELRNLSATQGITLHEYDDEEAPAYDMQDEFGGIQPAGAKALQLYSNATTERRQPLGYAVERQAEVHIYLMNSSDVEEYGVSQSVVLAHEFVHALQFQHDLLTPSRRGLRSHFPRWTTDSRVVTTALVEGDAMWVTEQYFDRYARQGNYSVTAYNRTLDRAAWPHSVAGLPYYYGYQFYEERGPSPEARSQAIAEPPTSTAELLHPGESVERMPLPAAPNPPADELTRYDSDTVGELVVRHALRLNGLSYSQSASIADGWANDRMYYFEVNETTDPVTYEPVTHWVTVWDNASEAREFADGWQSMLDANGAKSVGAESGGEESVGDALLVPATGDAPATYYVVERDGAVVRISTGPTAELAQKMADSSSH